METYWTSGFPMTSVDKSGDRVRKMFSEIAPRYDLLNHLLSLNIDRWWRWRTLERLELKPGVPVLDVCTGTGDLALAIAQKPVPEIQVLATDFCEAMLEIARTKQTKAGIPSPRLQFLESDTQTLPFASDTFQAVTVAFGLRNVSNTGKGIEEILRVCRPGGQVAILEFSKPWLPGLRQLYNFYFSRVLPWIGQAMARNGQGAYRYLPESVADFPSGAELVKILESSGLKQVRCVPMTFGVASLYLGRK